MDDTSTKFVISLVSRDRTGIIRSIATAINERNGNIEGMSQTVFQGYFTVILTAEFKETYHRIEIRELIENSFSRDETSVIVRPFEEVRPRLGDILNDRYILTLTGKDRPGILKTLTTYLAESNINIEDYYFTVKGDQVVHIGEVTIPKEVDIKQLQGELQALLSSSEFVVALQHENLFRATNDVFSVWQLLKVAKCEE